MVAVILCLCLILVVYAIACVFTMPSGSQEVRFVSRHLIATFAQEDISCYVSDGVFVEKRRFPIFWKKEVCYKSPYWGTCPVNRPLDYWCIHEFDTWNSVDGRGFMTHASGGYLVYKTPQANDSIEVIIPKGTYYYTAHGCNYIMASRVIVTDHLLMPEPY